MNLIDTYGWIEWLSNGKLCKQYAPYFAQTNKILVPASVQFELYKWIVKRNNLQHALEAIALTEQGNAFLYQRQLHYLPLICPPNMSFHSQMPLSMQVQDFMARF